MRCKLQVEERPLFSVCGTPEFMAPEVVAHSRGYGVAADWCAFVARRRLTAQKSKLRLSRRM